MKGILSVLGLVLLTTHLLLSPNDSSSLYQVWKNQYAIKYSPYEDQFRRITFNQNIRLIKEHNAKSGETYKMAANKFTAHTKDEFVKMYLGYKHQNKSNQQNFQQDFVYAGDIDWTTKGSVTRVKDQGNCGSCWAFSATGALEALYKLKRGDLLSFSEQQLVDCSKGYLTYGCEGGRMQNAFDYTSVQGITTDTSYPYVGYEQRCKNFTSMFKNFDYLGFAGCDNVYNYLQYRPIAVGVDASNWIFYSSGIFSSCNNNQEGLNHGVLLVGATDQYWKIKNSWSSRWGESGYIRLGRGNTCGICYTPSFPV